MEDKWPKAYNSEFKRNRNIHYNAELVAAAVLKIEVNYHIVEYTNFVIITRHPNKQFFFLNYTFFICHNIWKNF